MTTASTPSLTPAEARRIHLAAQGLARRRPSRIPRDRDFGAYLRHQGVLQLDSVNVLARAHEMPLYSRLGPYSRDAMAHWLRTSGEAFEHWGHEAAAMPRALLPAMHHRMVQATSWKARRRASLEAERPGLLAQALAAVEASGPLTSAELEHLAPRESPRGTWWDTSHVKDALELMFITGEVASARGAHFRRTYDSTRREWGLPPASTGDWGLPPDVAEQALFDHALAATGIGTPADIADHFRLPRGSRAPWATSAVERGLASWVTVEGWKELGLLATGASDPGRATASALLSPFDPVCWYRPRLSRMFGVDYRIEIYTPEHKRVFGYYCLLFLHGDRFEARVDLKALRKQRVLSVEATWREPGRAPGGGRRRDDAAVAIALAAELHVMAGWLGLDAVEVVDRGDLARELMRVLARPPVAGQ